jgi:hypothetical protein
MRFNVGDIIKCVGGYHPDALFKKLSHFEVVNADGTHYELLGTMENDEVKARYKIKIEIVDSGRFECIQKAKVYNGYDDYTYYD